MTVPWASERAVCQCSFCGVKSGEPESRFFIRENGVYICDECVDFCAEIVAEAREKIMRPGDLGIET